MDTILSVLAFVFSIISGGFTFYTFVWTKQRDRKQATLDAYNNLQTQAFDHLNKYMPKEIAEIAEDPRSEKFKEISTYIARIEHFCVGVNQKIYDFDTTYALARGYLDGAIKVRIEPIINKKNQFGMTDYYENIHQVLDRMAKYSEKDTGRKED